MAEQASQGRHHQPDSAPPPLPASGGRVLVKASKGGRKRGSAASQSNIIDNPIQSHSGLSIEETVTLPKRKRISHHTSQPEIPVRESSTKQSGRKSKLEEENIDRQQEELATSTTSLSTGATSKSKSKRLKHSVSNSDSSSKLETTTLKSSTSSRKLSPSSSKSTHNTVAKHSSKSSSKLGSKFGEGREGRLFSLGKIASHYSLRSQNKRSRGGGKRSKDLSTFTANLGSVESSSSSSGESCERDKDRDRDKVTRGHSSRLSVSAITGTCTSSRRWAGQSAANQSCTSSNKDNMADDQPPPDINPTSGAGGSSGGGLDSESDDSEVGRLQALLEARGLPPHLFGALAPRMHHLLHRTIGTNTSTKAQQLLQGLQASSDEGQQMQALTEMCQMLVMGNEDTLAGFPVKQVVPALINLLGMEHNFDMMNHACRALTYMMEALPRSSSVVLDAVPVFLEKLQSITCMDVAEQSLTALELLSRRHSKAILQARGVVACLTYLDFFGINAQRSALAVTANCCINIQPEELHLVSQSLPVLATRLTQQDQKSVESVCLALSRLVDGLQTDTAKLMEVATTEILTNLQQLLVVSPPIINSSTFITVVRMLTVMCSCSPELALTLLKSNIAETLYYLLTGRADVTQGEVELVGRAPQEVYEMTCLICELMPRLPRSQALFSVDSLLERPHFVHSSTVDAPTVSWQWRDDNGHWTPYPPIDSTMIEAAHQTGEVEVSLSTLGRMYTVDFTSMEQINEDTGTSRPVERRILRPQQLQHNQTNNNSNENEMDASLREVASSFIRSLFSVLYEVYSSSAGPAVRCKCLKALLRMVYFASPQLLKEVLKAQMVASQLAGMMASQDLRIVVSALQMAEILMQKLPDLFSIHFTREGVLYQIKQLADPGIPLGPSPTKLTPTGSSIQSPGIDSPLPGPSNTSNSNTNTVTATSISNTSSTHTFNGTICRIVPVSSSQNEMVDVINMEDDESPLSDCSPITRRMRELRKPKRVLKRDKHNRQDANSGATDFSPSMHDLLTKHKHSSQSIGSRTVRSRLSVATMKTGGFLASLNPARWGRTADRYNKPGYRKETGMSKTLSSSSLWAANREKVRAWVRERAQKFVSSFSALELNNASDPSAVLTSLTQAISSLNSLEEDKLVALVELCNTVMDCDISPFEVNHSGLVKSLLDFLTHKSDKRHHRIRTFLHVFTNCPMDSSIISDCTLDPTCLQALVSKLNSCVSQLEQFPVKVHDLPAPSGSTTALKFFNTHQLKCQLSRHPDCSNLKQWKGGTVKIDPLALVQAIERYLVVRGYAKIRDKHSSQSDDENSEEDIDDTLVGMAVGSTRHKLQFLINDQVLPYNMTVYQAIRQFSPAAATASDQSETDTDSEMPLGSANIWVQTHTVHYRPVADVENAPKVNATFTAPRKGKGSGSKQTGKKKMDELWNDGIVPPLTCAMDRYLVRDLNEKVTVSDASLPVLCLLNGLHTISTHWTTLYPPSTSTQSVPILPQQEFINSKIAAKAGRQLQDPLVIMTGNLPSWLQQIATACPFLLPFETRQLLLYATAFDRDRALQRLLDSSPELGSSGDSQERVTPRLDRRKRTVAREDILKQAETLISDMAQSKALLEVQYENEVGTGLGPTLEFYALVSRELQSKDLDLWHALDTPSDATHVYSPVGLYPQPIPRTARVAQLIKLRNKFRFIGKFMAKAVMDSRMLDLPLSRTFYRWILGEESSLTLSDLAYVNPSVHATLVKLYQIVNKYNQIQTSNEPQHIKHNMIQDLTLDNCPIENLGLDFTLPGYPNIEMRKGGKDIAVNIHNLEDYCKLVVHWYLVEGVSRQMECVREGVQTVFPISYLNLFYPDELDSVFCGSSTYWDMAAFIESCRTDHGYTPDSRAIKFLFEVLSSYDTQQQRDFVQFVTGSPRLPVGGFKALSPPITIVRKTVDGNLRADDFLPSVMTCVNYLKLPDYSSVELMRRKLSIAAREGQRSFHLS